MRVVIVGNGVAANAAAAALRGLDGSAAITMVAAEPHPLYSACALPDVISGWVHRDTVFLKQVRHYEEQGVEVRWGQRVTALDLGARRVVLGGEELPFDRLILATGSRPRRPAVPGAELAGNFVLKSVDDADAIMAHGAQRAVVVGSGNVGIEVAEALHHRGARVTLLEAEAHLMPRALDAGPAAVVAGLLRDEGIDVRTGQTLREVSGRERVNGCRTDTHHFPCDTVVWAVGMVQNVELAREAGLALGPLGGIAVNRWMETSVAGVYACGDCIQSWDAITGRPLLSLLWPSARRQGQVAGANCAGARVAYEGSMNLMADEVAGKPLISVGWTSTALAEAGARGWEKRREGQCWRMVALGDRLVGFQAVGVMAGLGALCGLVRSRMLLSEFWRVAGEPRLAERVPWLLPAADLLADGEP